jgi:mannose-6-phosphate isomerase
MINPDDFQGVIRPRNMGNVLNSTQLEGRKFEDLEIVRHLDDSISGNVYLGRLINAKLDVVVKVQSYSTQAELDFLRDKSSKLIHMSHKNIVRAYRLIEDPSNRFSMLIEELIHGFYLQRVLNERGKPVSPAQVLPIIRQLSVALDYSHKHEALHLDVRPANIYIESQNASPDLARARFCLANFSFSISSKNIDLGSSLSPGNYHSMAPEIWKPMPPTKQADIYSLGVVAYQLLSGHLPFEHEDAAESIRRIQSQAVPPIRLFVPDLPGRWEEAFDKVLAKDPRDRFSSCGEFYRELQNSLQSRRTKASQPTLTSRQEVVSRPHQFAVGSELYVETIDWSEAYNLVRAINQQFISGKYHPDKVIAVYDPASSGGYVAASNIAALVNTRMNLLDPEVGLIRVEGRQGSREVTKMPTIPPDVRNILLVDDVTWSGNTLLVAKKALPDYIDVKTCTLIAGVQSIDQKSVDFFGRRSDARDVRFPWGLVTPTAEFNQYFALPSLATKRAVNWAPRPWGFWEQFALNEPCTVRILTVFPNEILSLQYHKNRDEFFIALDDGAVLQIGDKQVTTSAGDYVLIPRLTVHRIIAPPTHSVRVLEVSFGHYDQIHDIVRLEDKYERTNKDGSV